MTREHINVLNSRKRSMEMFSRFKNHMDAVNGVLLVNREDTYHFLTYSPKLAVRNEQLLFHGPFGEVIPVNRFNML